MCTLSLSQPATCPREKEKSTDAFTYVQWDIPPSTHRVYMSLSMCVTSPPTILHFKVNTEKNKKTEKSSHELSTINTLAKKSSFDRNPKKEILAFQLVLGHFNGGNSPFLRKTKIHASETTDIAWKTNKQTHTPLLNERSMTSRPLPCSCCPLHQLLVQD